jgi:3-deoxy-D-manno-octulosonic-acid transferase
MSPACSSVAAWPSSAAASGGSIVLLDTLGELAGAYAAATVAFVGGSLVSAGGHNPIEPALWSKPVLFGPSMENFRAIAATLLEANGAFQVSSADEMGILLATLAGDSAGDTGGQSGRLPARRPGCPCRC